MAVTISGFTYVHNAIEGGYPIIEACMAVIPHVDELVIVDCSSTDSTPQILAKLAKIIAEKRGIEIKIVNAPWGDEAGETLRKAHSLYKHHCTKEIILHFEADEVYGEDLIQRVKANILAGEKDIMIHRLQLEQNFQRCRWYPEPVHRIFPRDSHTRKEGHTTNRHNSAFELTPKNGYLWDITNCFRDNWLTRIKQHAALRKEVERYILAPLHILHVSEWDEEYIAAKLQEKHWTVTNTPFDIPEVLKPLVGMTEYDPLPILDKMENTHEI